MSGTRVRMVPRWRREMLSVPASARSAFTAALTDATFDLTEVVDSYLQWASGRGSAAELAEALWMRVVATARETIGRKPTARRERILSDAGRIAAEAGYQLALQGRYRDATIAVESARAIAVTRLMGMADPETAAALRARGQEGLLAELETALRARVGLTSTMESSQNEIVRLSDEIASRTGRQATGEIATYESIRRAATRTPLVYLAAAKAEGYALVVRSSGEPQFVRLPGMGRDDVGPHVAAITRGPSVHTVHTCVDRIAVALAPLARRFRKSRRSPLFRSAGSVCCPRTPRSRRRPRAGGRAHWRCGTCPPPERRRVSGSLSGDTATPTGYSSSTP